jgi:ribose-phosphate pyrophosphokinase
VIGEVEGHNAIIIDDMIDTGGSICRAVEALKKAGAKDIYVACTHPVFSGSAIENLNLAPIKELVVTNTIPVPIDKHIDKLTVLSVGSIFAKTIKNVFENKSVSEIFGGQEHV